MIMQRPMSEYQSMSPAQILDDPHAPETLKIRARNQMSQQQAQLSAEAMKEQEYMERLDRYAYEREAQEGTNMDRQRTSR